MKPDYQREGVQLYCGDCREILPTLGKVDAVVTDPPYSERTHAGHDAMDGVESIRALTYSCLNNGDIHDISRLFCDACTGWIVWMTDHTLAPVIQKELETRDRYVFAPLPYYAPGSRVRLSGDGPSSWTIWIVVARTAAQSRWGTLPGGYAAQEGWRERNYIGGKPTALMEALVRDYSRKGDLVCDPFLGSGTTGVACVRTGRRFIGIEINPDAFHVAVRRIEAAFDETSLLDYAAKQEQLTL